MTSWAVGRSILGRVVGTVDTTVKHLTRLLLVGITLAVFGDILARAIFNHPFGAVDEISGFALLVLIVLGGARSLANGHQPRITALVDLLPDKWRRVTQGLVRALPMVFGLFLLISGYQFVDLQRGTTAPITGISLFYPGLVFPIAGAILVLYATYDLTSRVGFSEAFGGLLAVLAGFAIFSRFTVSGDIGVNATMIAALLLLLALSVPIPLALAMAAWVAVASGMPSVPPDIVVQQMASGLTNFVLLAVPLFLLTGALMNAGGVANRIVDVGEALFSRLPRGLGIADLFTSAVFADMSGSAVADAAAIGTIMVPRLESSGGFTRPQAAGLQAAAGSLGILFPPSITIILYSFVTGESLVKMFAALILPGVLVVVVFATLLLLLARRDGIPAGPRFSWARLTQSLVRAVPGLFTIVIVLGGIFLGLGTVTEIGAAAAVYTLLAGIFLYGGMSYRSFTDAVDAAVENSCRTLFVLASAVAVAFVLTASGGPQTIISYMDRVPSNQIGTLLLLAAFLIVLHLVLESSSTIIVVMPAILPLLQARGISVIQFGVVLNLTTALALITPPLGLCLVVVCLVSGVSVLSAARAAIPYALALVLMVVVAILIPGLSTALPSLIH